MVHTLKKRSEKRLKSLTNPQAQISISEEDKPDVSRVLAPYLRKPKRSKGEQEIEDEKFSFYLEKKPLILLQDLSCFMSDSVNLSYLLHETADVLKNVTKASGVALYLADKTTNEIYRHFLNDTSRHKIRWKMQEGTTVAAFVAFKKDYVLCDDILYDARFPDGLGYDDYTTVKSVLCIPITTPDGGCFAVIELYRDIYTPSFLQYDLTICVMATGWMGVAIHQNQERLALKRQQELNDYLLDLVRCYFADHVLMEKLMSEVVKFAKITLGAERGSFFILDRESDEMIAHLFDDDSIQPDKKIRVRFSKERGIAGLVARTGQTVNIKDAYTDDRFNKEVDQKTGFITRSILCMPILGCHGVLGVVQVINKKNGGCFTKNDENLFTTFSLYCAMAVHYTNINTQNSKNIHLNNTLMKVVQLQQKPCIHELINFWRNPTVRIPLDFDLCSWFVRNNEELLFAPQYILFMISQLIDPNEINLRVMMKFILTVLKFYHSKNPYHNFEHSFNVCHCMYYILKNNFEKFTKVEIKSLLIAALCQDIDHNALSNEFLMATHHPLAEIYKSAPLEHHHLYVTNLLLDNHKVFYMSKASFEEFRATVSDLILATDVSIYFKNYTQLNKLLSKNTFSWNDTEHRKYLKGFLMTACGFSGACKPFLTAKRISDHLYKEYYAEGDLVKKMGGCPISLKNRNQQKAIPTDQKAYIDAVISPCYLLLKEFIPNTENLYLASLQLSQSWQEVANPQNTKMWSQYKSIAKTYE